MILIADSGSSKCDWAYCDDNGKKLEIIKTIGLNPYFLSSNQILEKLEESSGLRRISKIVKRVFFYGAGCSEDSLKDILRRPLLKFFSEYYSYSYSSKNLGPNIICILIRFFFENTNIIRLSIRPPIHRSGVNKKPFSLF